MSLPDTSKVVEDLPRSLRSAVAPLKKAALGWGFGVVVGGTLMSLALHQVVTGAGGSFWLWLLGHNYLPGYAPTLPGALAGLGWGLLIGFAMGWFLAATRNLLVALWVLSVGAREQLRAHRDFLDEI